MKHIALAMIAAVTLLAGCESDSGSSGGCNANEVKSDCKDGKISRCLDGKWESSDCEGNASCKTDGTCGECKDGEFKADCKDGRVSQCVGGKWESTACAGNASCKTDGTCGECADGDSRDCELGANDVASATICANGQWSATKQACGENAVSCDADGKCGECRNGDSKDCVDETVNIEYEDLTVGNATMCENGHWSAEPKQCPGPFSCNKATSKCGECVNGKHKACTEGNEVTTAQLCVDGAYTLKDCSEIRMTSYRVSCHEIPDCTKGEECFQCGNCLNTNGSFLCLTKSVNFGNELDKCYEEARAECINGYIQNVMYCQQGTCNPTSGNCAVAITGCDEH